MTHPSVHILGPVYKDNILITSFYLSWDKAESSWPNILDSVMELKGKDKLFNNFFKEWITTTNKIITNRALCRTALSHDKLYAEQLSHAERCPGQNWVMLSSIPNRAESYWALWRTEPNHTELYPEQRWVMLSSIPNSAESCWMLTGTALSHAEWCPRQRWIMQNDESC